MDSVLFVQYDVHDFFLLVQSCLYCLNNVTFLIFFLLVLSCLYCFTNMTFLIFFLLVLSCLYCLTSIAFLIFFLFVLFCLNCLTNMTFLIFFFLSLSCWAFFSSAHRPTSEDDVHRRDFAVIHIQQHGFYISPIHAGPNKI